MVNLQNCSLPNDGIRHKEIQTNAFIGNRDLGMGTLFVTESVLTWIMNDGRGFLLDYPIISLHAISKDVSHFPSECIYLMAETSFEDSSGDHQNGDAAAEEDDNEMKTTEIRFVPVDKSSLEPIYQALSDCQALHPDENDSYSDDEDGEFFPAPNAETAEVGFDEEGQVVYQRHANMRGVVDSGNVELMSGDTNGHPNENDEDELMELGQYDDVSDK